MLSNMGLNEEKKRYILMELKFPKLEFMPLVMKYQD